MHRRAHQLFEFGPFRLDSEDRLLLHQGRPVPLPPKAADILLILLRNNGHVVHKDELLLQVWPDTFVEEANLAQNVSILRKALGESRGDHGYIETIPTRGYRFVAPLRVFDDREGPVIVQERTLMRVQVEEEGSEEAAPTVFAMVAQRLRGRGSKLAAVLVGVALVGGVAYFAARRKPAAPADPTVVRSIAVLPLQTIGSEEDLGYLGLGMADALITKLGKLRQIRVRPTSSVREYADGDRDVLAVGRTLGVDAVIDGNLQKSGQRIRVTVQLLQVRDGAVLWTGQFDEEFTGIFALQDTISEEVARGLALSLTPAEHQQATKRYTESAEAYRLFLQGRYFGAKRTQEGLRKSLEYFERAIEKDPRYALAHAGLAETYVAQGGHNAAAAHEAYPKAQAAARKALALDDTLAEAHTALAFVQYEYGWDWEGAEREFQRGIELNPGLANAHHWYAHYLMALGRTEEARLPIERALDLDPLSLIINANAGFRYYCARQYDQALDHYRKTLEMDPSFPVIHGYMGLAYESKGMYEQAVAEFQTASALATGIREYPAALAHAYAASGRRREAHQILTELLARSRREHVPSYSIAVVYVGLGDHDRAFAWLARAYRERSGSLSYLKVDPRLDSLRSDPRFKDLMGRVGLPEN